MSIIFDNVDIAHVSPESDKACILFFYRNLSRATSIRLAGGFFVAAALRVADSLPLAGDRGRAKLVRLRSHSALGQLGANLISSITRSIARRCDHKPVRSRFRPCRLWWLTSIISVFVGCL
ncbi:hypothetical protein EVAR_100059_1 [Eumeta japonica]|uniref:Uncharacterized protein n=1 Tax=Eumeta variegata TaxID=151549 RepID=A0A4C2A4Q2_EUMVA|nr:hypothetical protein EVAR_100059_1 [Eumeta japonica]